MDGRQLGPRRGQVRRIPNNDVIKNNLTSIWLQLCPFIRRPNEFYKILTSFKLYFIKVSRAKFMRDSILGVYECMRQTESHMFK